MSSVERGVGPHGQDVAQILGDPAFEAQGFGFSKQLVAGCPGFAMADGLRECTYQRIDGCEGAPATREDCWLEIEDRKLST